MVRQEQRRRCGNSAHSAQAHALGAVFKRQCQVLLANQGILHTAKVLVAGHCEKHRNAVMRACRRSVLWLKCTALPRHSAHAPCWGDGLGSCAATITAAVANTTAMHFILFAVSGKSANDKCQPGVVQPADQATLCREQLERSPETRNGAGESAGVAATFKSMWGGSGVWI